MPLGALTETVECAQGSLVVRLGDLRQILTCTAVFTCALPVILFCHIENTQINRARRKTGQFASSISVI
jgi:hypothetical protein